jgi:hypothetical protein
MKNHKKKTNIKNKFWAIIEEEIDNKMKPNKMIIFLSFIDDWWI